MAEFTGIAIQTVAQGEDVAFTETPVCATKWIVDRQGSGIVKLRGLTNQCRARFLVSYSGNIQIPTGGTVEAISNSAKRVYGVQFHPEQMTGEDGEPNGQKIFDFFLDQCRKRLG